MRQLSEHLHEHDPTHLWRWLQQHPSLRQVDDHLSLSTSYSAYSNNEGQWVRLVGSTTHSTARSTFFSMSSLPQPLLLPPEEQQVHGRWGFDSKHPVNDDADMTRQKSVAPVFQAIEISCKNVFMGLFICILIACQLECFSNTTFSIKADGF